MTENPDSDDEGDGGGISDVKRGVDVTDARGGDGTTDARDADHATGGETGVDAGEAAAAAMVSQVEDIAGESVGLLSVGDRCLALSARGVGPKLLVAAALDDYSTVGIDCVAATVNDLVAAGVDPVAFVDYLSVEAPDEHWAAAICEGLARGCAAAGVELLAGETAVLPEVVSGLDLAGTCAGLAPTEQVFDGEAEPGDTLVGFAASGLHTGGMALAREVLVDAYDYGDPFPPDPDRTVGEVLLEPTRSYASLLDPLREHGVHAAAHVADGGWTAVERMGAYRYEFTDPFHVPPVVQYLQEEGDLDEAELYRTFNVGMGFVAAVPPEEAVDLADRPHGKIVGRVNEGEGIAVRGLEL